MVVFKSLNDFEIHALFRLSGKFHYPRMRDTCRVEDVWGSL